VFSFQRVKKRHAEIRDMARVGLVKMKFAAKIDGGRGNLREKFLLLLRIHPKREINQVTFPD